MATLRVRVPPQEHPAEQVDYADASPQMDATAQVLLVLRGAHILAEYPLQRFIDWQFLEDE